MKEKHNNERPSMGTYLLPMTFCSGNGRISLDDAQKLYEQAMEQAILSTYTLPDKPSSDGYYHCQVEDHTKASGRRQIKAKTLTILKIKLLEYERSILGQSKKTFKQCFEIVISEKQRYVKSKEKSLSVQNTITNLRIDYNRFFSGTDFERKYVDEITKKDIENICFSTLSRIDLTKKAFMAMRGIIKAVLKLAFEEYWIKDNPYDRVNFKKYDDMLKEAPPVDERVHTDDDVERILDYIHEHQQRKPDYVTSYCLELVILAGLRRGEAPPLELSDIHDGYFEISKQQLTVKKHDSDSHDRDVIVGHTKTYVPRRFPITNEIQRFLERYLAIHERYHPGDPHLFPEPKNETGVISNRAVYKYYVRICRKLGIEISKDRLKGPHSFRRNGITKVTNNTGGDLMLASLIYGNSPPTAKKYYYTGFDLEKAKAALDK